MVVQQRTAALETVGHAGDVDLGQDVAGKIGQDIRAGGSRDKVAVWAFAVGVQQEPGCIVLAKALPELVGPEIVSAVRIEDADPFQVSPFRSLSESLGKSPGPSQQRLLPGRGRQKPPCRRGGYRPQWSGQTVYATSQCHGPITVVAGEQFVTTVAGECHGDLAAGHLRKVHGGDGRAVSERFVVMPRQFWKNLQCLWFDDGLVVNGAQVFGRHPRVVPLVELFDGEPDRKGVHRIAALLLHQPGDDRRVDSTGQKCPQGDITAEPQADGLGEGLPQCFLPLAAAATFNRILVTRPPVTLDRQLPVFVDGPVSRWQLAVAGEHRAGMRDVLIGEELVERDGVQFPGGTRNLKQRLQLAGEQQAAGILAIDQRFLAHAVTCQQQALPPNISYGQGEHSPQVIHAVIPVFLVQVDDHLGVALGGEPVAAALQVVAQFAVVVDLAVEDHLHRSVFVGQWLAAGVEVDDRKPSVAECRVRIEPGSRLVGSAMCQHGGHRVERGLIDRVLRVGPTGSGKSTHGLSCSPRRQDPGGPCDGTGGHERQWPTGR